MSDHHAQFPLLFGEVMMPANLHQETNGFSNMLPQLFSKVGVCSISPQITPFIFMRRKQQQISNNTGAGSGITLTLSSSNMRRARYNPWYMAISIGKGWILNNP